MNKKVTLLLLTSILLQIAPLAYGESADAIRYYNRGVDQYTKGNTKEAVRLFEKATLHDPNYTDAFYNLGSLYFQNEQFNKAQSTFQRVVELNPKDAQALYNLALCHEKLNNYQKAIDFLQRIPKNNRKYNRAQAKVVELSAKIEPDDTPALRTTKAKKPYPTPKLSVKTFAKDFLGPTGIAMDRKGTLYVADYSKSLIYKVNPYGEKSVFAEGEGLHGPIGLAVDDKTGDLFVANYAQNNIAKVDSYGDVSIVASGLNKPYYLYLDRDQRVLYISEQETNTISKIKLPKDRRADRGSSPRF